MRPKGYDLCLQGLHGIEIITPGTSTVDHVQDYEYCELARFTDCLKHSVDKRLPLCLDCYFHPMPTSYRYVRYVTSLHSARLKLPTRYHERTRLTVTTAVWLYNPTVKIRKFIEKSQEMAGNINSVM